MKRFKKILVGVDLSNGDRFVAEETPATTVDAIRQAELLAKTISAEILLFYVLPTSAEQLSYDRQVLMALGEKYKSVYEHASEVLSEAADRLTMQGLKASSKVVFGKSWVEIIGEVIRGDHDIVIAGTRNRGPIRSMLFGSTGLKLLRKCPGPVWITKPNEENAGRVDSILVAHDLTEVGDKALELGCTLANAQNASLHVVHAIEYQNPASSRIEQIKIGEFESQIQGQLEEFGKVDARIHVSIGDADQAILNYAERHAIQLVVMGTIARVGVFGVLMGNTAEKLLPFLRCSVIAIKPDEFKSPVP